MNTYNFILSIIQRKGGNQLQDRLDFSGGTL